MLHLGDTINRLREAQGPLGGEARDSGGRLRPLGPCGTNPGNLAALHFVPDRVERMPLVVVLHGCTQTAAGYDRGSGWSALAERHGFAVLLPEQQRANNPNLCFNWFAPGDVRRGAGEVLSIREMIGAMIVGHPIDPDRVFVTGLSAGGAMAAALLASYPEVFAGGAIMAGLPFGTASTVSQALDRMRGHGHGDTDRYGALVRAASDHPGPWPTIAVWHGTADVTVAPINADAILDQWRGLHGVPDQPDRQETVDGAVHRIWRDARGRVCLEDYRIPAMGHGTPIATRGPTACGSPAAFMLDVGISSTWHSAARWGLLDPAAATRAPLRAKEQAAPAGAAATRPPSIQASIETALRAAGLMR